MKLLISFTKNIILIIGLIVITVLLGRFVGIGVNHLELDTQDLAFERIIFVPGIFTPSFYLKRWKEDLTTNFPDKEIIFLASDVYFYWQDEKTEEVVEEGVALLEDGKPTLVIAHSYGGVLAKTMIKRAESSDVVELITMASPHQMDLFGIDNSKEFLKTPATVNVPTYSFGGYVDPIVLFPWTDISDDEDEKHQDLWSNHGGFLFNKAIRREVLEYALGSNDIRGLNADIIQKKLIKR